MSDSILSLIPDDPTYVPLSDVQPRAIALLRALAPRASHVGCRASDQVVFFDQGSNFEKVQCPACGEDVTSQWPEWMSKAFESQFADLALTMSCCGLATNLNALGYLPPAGFARFSLTARNPNVGGLLSAEDLSVLERVIGCKLRQVYARY
jgi:hypothetical protein